MNAIPVIRPATVTDVFQAGATEPLSMKKNTVAANMPIEITQKEIPTKSSDAKRTVSAFATPDIPIRATAVRTNNLIFFIKNPSLVSFYLFSLYKLSLDLPKQKLSLNIKLK
jgi:hypothetical protein